MNPKYNYRNTYDSKLTLLKRYSYTISIFEKRLQRMKNSENPFIMMNSINN